MNKLLVGKSDRILIQLVRYGMVGGVAFAADFSLLWMLTDFLKFHYLFSAALSFVVGVLVNYFLSTAWVFTIRRLHSARMEFLLFALIGLVGLALNEGIIWFTTEYLGQHYLVSKFIATGLVYLWNFLARRQMLFN